MLHRCQGYRRRTEFHTFTAGILTNFLPLGMSAEEVIPPEEVPEVAREEDVTTSSPAASPPRGQPATSMSNEPDDLMVIKVVTRSTQPPTTRGPIRPREDLFAPERKPEPVNLARVGRQGGGPFIPRAVTVEPPVVPTRAQTTAGGAAGATSQSTSTPMTPTIPLQRQGIVIPLPALFLGPGDGQNGVTYQPAPISNLTPEQAFKMVIANLSREVDALTTWVRAYPMLLETGKINRIRAVAVRLHYLQNMARDYQEIGEAARELATRRSRSRSPGGLGPGSRSRT